MKRALRHKTAKLGEHIPGFVGYETGYTPETDLLLRRHLAAEIEKVRDRLADFLASRKIVGAARENFAQALRTAAFLKETLTPRPGQEEGAKPVSPREEERLLDFDLALLEKVAGLNTPLDMMEAVGETAELLRALALFEEGLAEVDDLFRKRREILHGE
jgi:hypothetical protein